jgi:mannose/fructose/N-acetylgalactosamine-specific phosphotransferase system component IID
MSAARRSRRALVPSLLRLFTVQGSYNYDRMQGIGVAVAEEPLVRGLRAMGNGARYRAALARGARLFNAHPYLCGLAVGATARAELDGAPPGQIERLRAALGGPLGALGDRLVWAGWLPLTSALALLALARGAGLAAVLGFLVAYNLGHVALRWWALRAGWTHGMAVVTALHQPAVRRAVAFVGPAMAAAAGAALPVAAQALAAGLPPGARPALVAVAAVGVALLWGWRTRLSGLRLALALLGVAALGGWLWR